MHAFIMPDIITVLATVAPEAAKILRDIKTRKIDEQTLILIGALYQSHIDQQKSLNKVLDLIEQTELRVKQMQERMD
jgi:division protein CdvB (Snf7/Vps24/ESCRT-III family)